MFGTVKDTEFDKLNVQLLKESKEENNLIINLTPTELRFSNGNKYTYDVVEKVLYLNNNIKVCENVTEMVFSLIERNNKQHLKVTVSIDGQQRVTEYIMKTGIVKQGEKALEYNAYISGGKVARIPQKFTVSGVPSENTIDNGLVIYLINDKTDEEIAKIDWTNGETVATLQKTYDQFVWVPVDDINDMFMCQSEDGTKSCRIIVENGAAKCKTHNSNKMAGRLYATEHGGDFNFNLNLTTQTYTTNSGIREPDIITGSNTGTGISLDGSDECLTQMSSVLGTEGYDTRENFKETLQNDYNNIVKSVYNAKGFWVGRYETSNITTESSGDVKVIAGVQPSQNISWYYMYSQQKRYAINKEISNATSSMIQGAAYDQVLKFVNGGTRPDGQPYDITATNQVGHISDDFITKPYQTGGRDYLTNYTGSIEYNDLSKNIYDLEGNVLAWTTEAFDIDMRGARGGICNDYENANSASYRIWNGVVESYSEFFGSIIVIYVNI